MAPGQVSRNRGYEPTLSVVTYTGVSDQPGDSRGLRGRRGPRGGPDDAPSEPEHEETLRLDPAAAGEVLVDVGKQFQERNELTLTTDECALPFALGEPVELEVDFDGVDDPGLDLEIELPGRTDERAPGVE